MGGTWLGDGWRWWWSCHITGMETEIDLRAADRDTLIAIIIRQQAIIDQLEKQIAQLEERAKSGGNRQMPGLKPKTVREPAQPRQPRQRRRYSFARVRMTPTQRVEHVLEQWAHCGTQAVRRWTRRTREVIDLPQAPVVVTEHGCIARTCPSCRRRSVPPVQLEGVALGQQRLGTYLLTLTAALLEEAKLPFRIIQWYLDTVHGLRLSVGAIVVATHRVAQKA